MDEKFKERNLYRDIPVMKIKWSIVYSSCLGIGFFPWFPGTMGSIFGFFVYLLLPESYFSSISSGIMFSILLLGISLISVPIITRAEKYLGHDSGKIVIDELIGYLAAVMFMPQSLIAGITGLVFFRIFDIWKPGPVNSLQRLSGGWGVMADDIMAGIFANIFTRIVIKIIL